MNCNLLFTAMSFWLGGCREEYGNSMCGRQIE
jgi:hypothetical protein